MINLLFIALLVTAVITVQSVRMIRMLIWFGVFSLVTSLCYLCLSAPDVALAEIAVSTMGAIIFLIAIKKYLEFLDSAPSRGITAAILRHIPAIVFSASLAALFIYFMPNDSANTYLKAQYLELFKQDIGGDNAVTAILLGYRMYDTVFESLMMVVGVAAVIHLSLHENKSPAKPLCHTDKNVLLSNSIIADSTIWLLCPFLVLMGLYLGGFQGGVILGGFLICRFIKKDVQNVRQGVVNTCEEVSYKLISVTLLFAGILVLAAALIVAGGHLRTPLLSTLYIDAMCLLVGFMVACGFQIIFYRFYIYERT
jgi:multisubunit Na+/H+ antiporter MnhB subunit